MNNYRTFKIKKSKWGVKISNDSFAIKDKELSGNRDAMNYIDGYMDCFKVAVEDFVKQAESKIGFMRITGTINFPEDGVITFPKTKYVQQAGRVQRSVQKQKHCKICGDEGPTKCTRQANCLNIPLVAEVKANLHKNKSTRKTKSKKSF